MDAADEEVVVRRKQLKAWIDAHYDSTRAFCLEFGLNESDISQLLRQKSFGSRRARNLEQKTGMPSRYLEGIEALRSDNLHLHTKSERAKPWPFKLASYDDYKALSPEKKHELDIRVSEFIAGAKKQKLTA